LISPSLNIKFVIAGGARGGPRGGRGRGRR
jgi:hypothetical protein